MKGQGGNVQIISLLSGIFAHGHSISHWT